MTFNRFIDGGVRHFDCGSWQRDITYATRLGIVLIHMHYWRLAGDTIERYKTEFEFIHNGILYERSVDHTNYTDNNLKNISTRFVKYILRNEIR